LIIRVAAFYVSTEEQKVRRAHMASYTAVAVLGVASPHPPPPVRTLAHVSPNETGCKVAGLHNSMAMASHSWSQITPLSQSFIMSSEMLAPQCRCGNPTGHPKLLQLETPLLHSTLADKLFNH